MVKTQSQNIIFLDKTHDFLVLTVKEKISEEILYQTLVFDLRIVHDFYNHSKLSDAEKFHEMIVSIYRKSEANNVS